MPDVSNTSRLLPQPGESDRMRRDAGQYAAAFYALRAAGLDGPTAHKLAYNGYCVLPLSALEAK